MKKFDDLETKIEQLRAQVDTLRKGEEEGRLGARRRTCCP